MRKVIVVGGPGSGKTSFAAALARDLGVQHVELDALWWAPEWTPVGELEFRSRVAAIVAGDGWVLDGHYLDEGAVDLVWPAADTLVWLDLPRAIAVRRCLRRTTSRVVRGTELDATDLPNLDVVRLRTTREVAAYARSISR